MDANDLFEKHEWTGEFFSPFQFDDRFAGTLSYGPEEGLVLSYTTLDDEQPSGGDVLYGVLNTGQPCTLVGGFTPEPQLPNLHYTLLSYRGRTGVGYLLIGDYWTADQKVFDLEFTLTNLQEFFYPSHHKDLQQFSLTPIFQVSTAYGALEVRMDATFRSFDDELLKVHSEDAGALQSLREAVEAVLKKHPDAMFWDRNEFRYLVHLTFTQGVTVREAYRHVSDIAGIVSLLTSRPVYPNSLCVVRKGDSPRRLHLYPTIGISGATLKLCRRTIPHHRLPITASTVALQSVLSKWLAAPEKYRMLVSSVQHETGFRDLHSAHGEMVLYATQLEAISTSAGKGNKEKYEFPLTQHVSQRVQTDLMKCFGVSTLAEVGKCISELRNEIAHVERPKKLLKKLDLKGLMRVTINLQLVLIGYALADVGVPSAVITNYQKVCGPQ